MRAGQNDTTDDEKVEAGGWMSEAGYDRRSWGGYVVAALAGIVGLIWVGSSLRGNWGLPLDDSWIHQEIARNLIRYHTWGFVPGVASPGSSSALWTMLLSLHYLLIPNVSPVWWPLLLNSVLLVVSCMLLYHMALKDRLPREEAWALALLPGLSGNFVWLVFTSMEHVLFVTLSLAAIVLWYRDPDATRRGMRDAVLAGIVLGLLGMTRPEGVLLSVLLFAIYRKCGRTLRETVWAAVLAFIFMLPSFLISLWTSGSLLPATSRGRRLNYTGSPNIHIGRSSVKLLMGETYTRVIGHHFFGLTGWAILPFVLLALWGTVVLLRRYPNRTSILCVWSILHYASYVIILPADGHGGRYQPFVLVLFSATMAIALLDLARRFPVRRTGRMALQTAGVVAVALLTLRTLQRWEVANRDSIYDINHEHKALGLWMKDNLPADTTVAVTDIGAIAYFSNLHILDVGGLIDPKFVEDYSLKGRTPEYIREHGAHYVVMAHDANDPKCGNALFLFHNPAFREIPLHTTGIDYPRWKLGNDFTQHGFRFQTIYLLEGVPPAEQSREATEEATRIATAAMPDSKSE